MTATKFDKARKGRNVGCLDPRDLFLVERFFTYSIVASGGAIFSTRTLSLSADSLIFEWRCGTARSVSLVNLVRSTHFQKR